MTNPVRVDVVTFGCRLNAVESEAVRRAAEDAGHSDTIVFNTCAVTQDSTTSDWIDLSRGKRDRAVRRRTRQPLGKGGVRARPYR